MQYARCIILSLNAALFRDPLVTNELSHPYHLDESIFIFISFFDQNHLSKQNGPHGALLYAALHVGLLCLPMSHKKYVRLTWIKVSIEH